MNNHPIQEVDSRKHLGLVFLNDGAWHEHINIIKPRAWTRINVMRKLKYKFDRKR